MLDGASRADILKNPKYTGRWAFGRNKNTYDSDKGYGVPVPRDKPLKEKYFEHLRIIDDQTWHRAQELRASCRPYMAGRKRKKPGPRKTRLLSGLLVCAYHNHPLRVGGSYGTRFYCARCKSRGQQLLSSRPSIGLVQQLVCQTLADMIRQDQDLVDAIRRECEAYVASLKKPDHAKLEALRTKATKLTGKIQFIFDAPGETDMDRAEKRNRLETLQRERAHLHRDIADLEAAYKKPVTVPNEKEILQEIDRMAETLLQAAGNGDLEDFGAARRIVEELTGGKIEVTQQGDPAAKRRWCRGTFPLKFVRPMVKRFRCDSAEINGPEISIDFRRKPMIAQLAEPAKALFDQGRFQYEIANKLNIDRLTANRAIACWFDSRGLPKPDMLARKTELLKNDPPGSKYKRLADDALKLYEQNLTFMEIGRRLGSNDVTAAKAIRYAQKLRGLATKDGRTRFFQDCNGRTRPLRQVS